MPLLDCGICGGSGGGDEPALMCRHCLGRGTVSVVLDPEDDDEDDSDLDIDADIDPDRTPLHLDQDDSGGGPVGSHTGRVDVRDVLRALAVAVAEEERGSA